MKKIKKLTAVFLAVIMALSVLTVAPFTVSAAGNSMGTATNYDIGNTIYGSINSTNTDDFYKIQLTYSGRLNIRVNSWIYHTCFDIYDIYGKRVWSSSIKGGNDKVACSMDENVYLTSGIYYLQVSRWIDSDVGIYNFTINHISANESFKETSGGTNNDMQNANIISLNTRYYGQIAINDEIDFYKFTLKEQSQINIIANTNILHTYFDIYDVYGKKIWGTSAGGNDKVASSIDEKINLVSGIYYLCVSKWIKSDLGNYNFLISTTTAPTSIYLNQTSLTLGAGESYTLTKSVYPYNASTSYTWSSSNTSVAAVSNGKVTAKKSGTANITVKTSNGKTATCKVTVKPAPTSVKTNPASVTLGVGEKYTISESTNSGTYANASNLKWSTSNSSVATVTKGSGNKATVTAKGVGTAYVKITLYNGKTAQCKVTVKPAPTSVKSYPASVTLGKGENYTIAAGTNSGSWSTIYTWSSSNNSVATVTGTTANKAKITAKGTGTATITIRTFNGKTATCKVTVKSAPSNVKVNPSNITLKKGASYTISESTNSGTYANADNLKWSTSNSSVATVKKGSGNKATVTAKSKGTAYIKITLYNGKTAQCKVTVK